MENEPQKNSDLILTNRADVKLTGVIKIISVKDDLAQIETTLGNLQLLGSNLQVVQLALDKGEANLTGNIHTIKYGDRSSNFLKKLFK